MKDKQMFVTEGKAEYKSGGNSCQKVHVHPTHDTRKARSPHALRLVSFFLKDLNELVAVIALDQHFTVLDRASHTAF